MFGHKNKAAVAALPPQHRALAIDGMLSVAQTPAQWNDLFASLTQHEALVRKPALPPRVREVVLPLVRALSQDVEPDGIIGATIDLRGNEAPGKVHPGRQLPPIPPVIKIDEQMAWDPWLVLRADLHDDSQLDLTVTDVVRTQKLRKRSASGKTKLKTKRKVSQRITVTLKTAKGAIVVPPPPSPATNWLGIRDTPKDTRHVIAARAKYALPEPALPGWQLKTVMLAIAEVFRWVATPDDAVPGSEGVA